MATNKTTTLRVNPKTYKKAKACAALIDEELYEFVDNSLTERMEGLVESGRLKSIPEVPE